MWKNIRISILLLILIWAAVTTWQDHHQNWQRPIFVLLHPINADADPKTAAYLQQLSMQDYLELSAYLQEMSKRYRMPIQVYVQLGRQLQQAPPGVPQDASIWRTMLWSLKFRFYAWQQQQSADGSPSVTLYLNYQQAQAGQPLPHSTALQKGRIGVVHLFATPKQREQNQIMIMHELLHAFGASDKYNLSTGQPIYPHGYATPEQRPLYPQAKAEIMAVSIPSSPQSKKMAQSLKATVIQMRTAQELGWIKD